MKRKLAVLLALSLTLSPLPATGVMAAEAENTEATVVEEVQENAEVEGTSEVVTETETETEETTETVETKEETTEEVTVPETTEEVTEEVPSEGNTEETTEEASESATEGVTDQETAAVEEPEAVVEETADVTAATAAEELVKEEAAEKAEAKVGWVKSGTKMFYYRNGKKLTGWKTVDGHVYYFADSRYPSAPTGQRLTGWKTIGGYVFFLADSRTPGYKTGEQLTGWQTIEGKTYYFADSRYPSKPVGSRLTGFKTISGNKYYFADHRYKSQPTGARLTGWKTIDGKVYYFVDSKYPASKVTGKMLTGIKTIGGKSYFFADNGQRQTGWVKTKGGIWGFYTSSGAAGKTGWKSKDGDYYYLTSTGRAKTGWLTLNAKSKFYLDASKGGRMVIGPKKFASGNIFFFDSEGRLATTKGWKYYEDGSYYTYSNGKVAVNTTIEGIKVGSDGKATMTKMDLKAQSYSSDTNYLILCDKSTFKVCVYKGKKGAWVRIKGEWPCTHGGSNTPNGVFHTEGQLTKHSAAYGWGDFQYTSAAFCTHISAGNFFHSILFDKYSRTNPYNLYPVDDALYKSYSHGCIRLELQNADWIYHNIPWGTAVVVYYS